MINKIFEFIGDAVITIPLNHSDGTTESFKVNHSDPSYITKSVKHTDH